MKHFNEYKKGDMVQYGDRAYPLQDNGKGSLHIVYWESGRRKKIILKKIIHGQFKPYSFQDYVFNGRFLYYKSFDIYAAHIHH